MLQLCDAVLRGLLSWFKHHVSKQSRPGVLENSSLDVFILRCEREDYSREGVEAIVGVKWDKWGPGEHYLATHKGQIWSHTNWC